jgi:hypothetical protein
LSYRRDKLKEALIKAMKNLYSAREARRQHKAWGGAKRNPRIVDMERESPRSGRQR